MEKDLIEFIAKSLVTNPDEVNINLIEGGESDVLELRVAGGDEGRIIGKRGCIAKAMRTVLQAACALSGKRMTLEILG